MAARLALAVGVILFGIGMWHLGYASGADDLPPVFHFNHPIVLLQGTARVSPD